jgi:hypothetical protein
MHKAVGSWYVHNDNAAAARGGARRRAGSSAISGADFGGLSYNPRT